jgi:hypothetical protein
MLVGLFGGVVMAATAGARRTATAFDRFADDSAAADLSFDAPDGRFFDEVRSIAGVAAAGRETSMGNAFWVRDDRVRILPTASALVVADGALVGGVDRLAIRHGRAPRPGAAEAVANAAWLQATGLKVGDRLTLRIVPDPPPAELQNLTLDNLLGALQEDPSLGWEDSISIVGEGAGTAEVARDEASRPARLVMFDDVASRVWRTSTASIWSSGETVAVRLAGGTDQTRVESAIEALPSGSPPMATLAEQRRRVRAATGPYVFVLLIFAVLVGLVGSVVAGGATARQALSDAHDDLPHRVFGADRRLLRRFALTRAALQGVFAATIAVLVALGGSLLFPLGPVARLDPRRGMNIDIVVLLVGAVTLVVGLAAISWLATSLARRRARPVRTTPTRQASRALPLVPALGFGFAFPRNRSRFVVRPAVVALAVAFATAAAVAVVTGSLADLMNNPSRYGTNWDVAITCNEGYCPIDEPFAAEINRMLREQSDVQAWSYVAFGSLPLRGRPTPAVGATLSHGGPWPFTLISGRAPGTNDEMVLGETTMRRLGVTLGDRVEVGGGKRTLQVVGSVSFTGLGQADSERASLGVGAGLTSEGLQAQSAAGPEANAVLVIKNRGSAQHLVKMIQAAEPGVTVISDHLPGPLAAWADLRWLPIVLAALVAALAITTLLHAIVLSAPAREHEIAILRAIGLRHSEARRALAWQSLFLTAAGLLAGVPLGILLGARVWSSMRYTLALASPTRVLDLRLLVLLVAAAAATTVVIVAMHLRKPKHVAEMLRSDTE